MERSLNYYRQLLFMRIDHYCLLNYNVHCTVDNLGMIFNFAKLGKVNNKIPVFICWLFGDDYVEWYLAHNVGRYIFTSYLFLKSAANLGIESPDLEKFLELVSFQYAEVFDRPVDRISTSLTEKQLIKFFISTFEE